MSLKGKIYFASDFHFGIPDRVSSRFREDKFVQWLDQVSRDAEEIFLLGDLFDFWFEYKTVIPRGYVRVLGKLAEVVDRGIPIHFFRGNHDLWAFRYLQEEVGLTLYREPVSREFAGKKFFIAHGDGLGPGDYGYKILRNIFELKFNQFLFRWLHPDIGTRLGLYWSARSRYAHMLREARQARMNITPDFSNTRLAIFCREKLNAGEYYDYFVFGHWHVAHIEQIGPTSFYIHLGDWLTNFTYGVFDGETFQLHRFDGLPDSI